MAKKDRDYEVILKACKEFADAVESTRRSAELLQKEADVAEATLKDDVSKKNIEAIKELAETILKTTAQGEERVRELERKMKSEKNRLEEMER